MSKIKINTDILHTLYPYNTKEITIFVLSDLHDDGKEKRVKVYKDLLSCIEKEEPNYIAVAGDIIQSKSASISNVDNFIKDLGTLAPTIVSVGNHEQETVEQGISLDWFHNLERHTNVFPLDNQSITLNNIQFTGFNPNLEVYLKKKRNRIDAFVEDFKKAELTPSRTTDFNIMLTHNPEFITKETLDKEKSLKNYDLYISGHTHNGCTPTFLEPFLSHRGLLGPYWTLFPNNCRKITDIYNSRLFISKGFRKFTQEIALSDAFDQFYPNDVHKLILKK